MQTKDAGSFITRYQSLYDKDPKSKIFAPLAEAYRREGFLERALHIAEGGVKQHPHFASGRVALGKCYFDKKDFAKASEQLKVATDLSPENILGHQLLAECELRIGRKKEALNAYKMVLFLNPADSEVARHVKTLEGELMHFDFEEVESPQRKSEEPQDEYMMKPLRNAKLAQSVIEDHLEKELVMFDTWFNRGDWNRAREILSRLGTSYGNHIEVKNRRDKLAELSKTNFDSLDDLEWLTPLDRDHNQKQIQQLEKLLSRVDDRKRT